MELIRQFYDVTRSFRITGPNLPGGYDFVELNNLKLQDQPAAVGSDGQTLYRKPVFDLKIKAQKKNPFSRAEQNQRAQDLYSMGFFNPERAQESLGALDMMEFEGIDKVREYVQQGQTLLALCQQLTAENAALKAALGIGTAPAAQPQSGEGASGQSAAGGGTEKARVDGALNARQPMTDYGTRLAQRSTPDMNTK